MTAAVAEIACRKCTLRQRDGLYLCSQCRRWLVERLDLPRDVKRDLAKVISGPKLAIRAVATIDPNAPKCSRCTNAPRERDSVFCASCKVVVKAVPVATKCKHCSSTVYQDGCCSYHFAMHGKRSPNGD